MGVGDRFLSTRDRFVLFRVDEEKTFFFLDFFEIIQKSLDEQHLKSIVAAQIEQCRKTIHLCQLKDRAEQV